MIIAITYIFFILFDISLRIDNYIQKICSPLKKSNLFPPQSTPTPLKVQEGQVPPFLLILCIDNYIQKICSPLKKSNLFPPQSTPTPLKVQEGQFPPFLLILCNKFFYYQMAQKTRLSAFKDPGMSVDFY